METVDCLLIGSGEYTTGYVDGSASKSDKGAGVVGLTMFDLRSAGKVGRVAICGTNGKKMPGIRDHLKAMIADKYEGIDVTCDTFPADGQVDRAAYLKALDTFPKKSVVTVFTPDDTHYEIALAAVKRGMHVLLTKPPVKTLEHHLELMREARENGVLLHFRVR